MSGDKRFTYADYAGWDDGKRYELIDGIAYMMAPGPGVAHQDISGELATQFRVYLRGKQCRVFPAPFDVRLNPDAGDDTVVQPDITIVCDPKKLENGKNCRGAPDMVVEILSPSSVHGDTASVHVTVLESLAIALSDVFPPALDNEPDQA